ncbi:5-methyltetrahydropteroyltriglutamate--homocysteine S-methyltransferase [Salipaludibacillus agaradhaerens]|uniref:5-methyltetrahydropteroyltriglutamate-- homocysteine S-methyltransferase n=1 Tax=Salipaludibacillus agaradhaerens TaxID=76935 RepID=UPI0021515091|nr:5-methyltetrahydropteroyltriglutamate--homocysteine S-methyltransferase [Salipaludibacillus agaradhaerens]MCR6105842.1 5-methyltetrahydropteroyltriglutamate--homocysteine S-methyltransferase [Salipaludibacillus agaradhaerens]MCR6117877.1 5-methyltetrahydropteroyltriglutamate--homocysteine S-methyltransferase [Salipaludibacillus agaradhaerens]
MTRESFAQQAAMTGPFRYDHVGSFLRPDRLKKARKDNTDGIISDDKLRTIEDEEIKGIVEEQKKAGHLAITDGEFRRRWWHLDFLEGLTGVEGFEPEQGYQFKGIKTKAWLVRVIDKLDFPNDHPFIEHFRFLKSVVGDEHVAKQTIPSPNMLYTDYSFVEGVYDDRAQFRKDLAAAYKKAIKAFYEAGCRYLQLDDVAWAVLIPTEKDSEEVKADKREKQQYFKQIINEALEDKPDDLVVTMHICRGNFRSTWAMSGGYDPVAKTIFEEVKVDGFFLEYDDERSGTFEPLKYLTRKDATVVLGLVSSKIGELEKRETIKARIKEASEYVPSDQLALSPQCGFASTEEGNILTEAQQWEKMKFVKDVAEEVWND